MKTPQLTGTHSKLVYHNRLLHHGEEQFIRLESALLWLQVFLKEKQITLGIVVGTFAKLTDCLLDKQRA